MKKSKIIYYCKDCNKQISIHSALYGSGFCKSCINKRRIHPPDCQCCICKVKKGESIGKNNPMFGKKRPDLAERNKLFRPDTKGEKNGMFDNHNFSGEKASNYIDGRYLILHYCIDCGKELINYKATRCMTCASLFRMKIYGAPNYIHGHSFDPYPTEFNNKLKDIIRERDQHRCQICNKIQEDELKDLNHKLSVHHVDYNKNNCSYNNLISLCLKCHLKTNINRKYWEEILCPMVELNSLRIWM
jgi:hypothetical protein